MGAVLGGEGSERGGKGVKGHRALEDGIGDAVWKVVDKTFKAPDGRYHQSRGLERTYGYYTICPEAEWSRQ